MQAISTPANVLIVEDDHVYAERVIAPHFEKEWCVQIVHNVPQSLAAARSILDLRLAIVDLDIPGGALDIKVSGGAGFEVMEVLKARFPQARIVVLTSHFTPMLVNKAQRMGVEYVAKGDCTANLRVIAAAIRDAKPDADAPAIQVARVLANSSGLTARQTEVLVLLVRNFTREEIIAELEISEWTLKTHVRAVLRGTGHSRAQELLRKIGKMAAEV